MTGLMTFPADAVPELPLCMYGCPRCDTEVTPFEQASAPSAVGTTMQLCHYQCPTCGCTWGWYRPRETP